MRTAHFDCFSGISGDMTLAAMIDAGVDPAAIRAGLDSLHLPFQLHIESVRKGGLAALQVKIEAPDQEEHRHLADIERLIDNSGLNPRPKELARRIFRRLAEAEATVHGLPVEQVHFHEVGALDSIADIVGTAIAVDLLNVEHFTSRSVPTGHGMVKAAHGLMPIPAPATAELLKGVPLARCDIKSELTTPTGAAILVTLVQEWVEQPVMKVESIGYGAGQRDLLDQANVLRLFVGASDVPATGDLIWVLETNLDDVPAEIVAYTQERLFAAGALDVFTVPIQMKKNRPGVLVSVLADDGHRGALEDVLFRETGTFGVRRHQVQRTKLERREHHVSTRWGDLRGKLGWLEGRSQVFTPEYEDCARVARTHNIPLQQVFAEVRRAYEQGAAP